MNIIKASEEVTETVYRLVIEHEGEEFTWFALSSNNNSYTEWYNKDWKIIDQPDWADELDMWEIYNTNCGEN
jgi:hypothetical protein